MTLKQLIIDNLTLTVNTEKDISNIIEDTIITYGRMNQDPSIIMAYGNHYDLPASAICNNIDNFKEYKRSGELVRYNRE